MEAFDQEIPRPPLMNKEVKEQKLQLEAIGCSLPLLTDRVTRAEENLGGVYQKVLDMDDYMKTIEKALSCINFACKQCAARPARACLLAIPGWRVASDGHSTKVTVHFTLSLPIHLQ